jgi:hypothetical protein
MADRQDLNTIVSDIHFHGKNSVQRDLVNLRDVMDRGDLQQYQQDLLRITIQLKALEGVSKCSAPLATKFIKDQF